MQLGKCTVPPADPGNHRRGSKARIAVSTACLVSAGGVGKTVGSFRSEGHRVRRIPVSFFPKGGRGSLGSGLFGGSGSGGVGTGVGFVGIGAGNGSVGVGKAGSVGVTGASGGTSGSDASGRNHLESGR